MPPARGPRERVPGADLVADPYPFYARLRREAPVWRVPGAEAFLVSTWELVAEAAGRVEDFSNHFRHALFSEGDGAVGVLRLGARGPDVFAGADPPEHSAHRKAFTPALLPRRIELLEGFVSDLAGDLVDALLAHPQPDAAAGLANPLPMRVIAERVIGFRDPDLDQTQRWVFAGSRMMGGRLRLDEMAEVGAQAAGMLPWVEAQLGAALAAPASGDLLGAAAAAVREGSLSREGAALTLMVLVGAGGETTTSLIGNAIRVLAERPPLQDELRADPRRVPAFVEEILRYESPFRFHPRTALRPVELGGVSIPEGALVALLWGAANRDESVFDRPDEIVLERPNARLHLGFGRGIHYCIGAPLARLEARIALTRLLERTRRFALDSGRPPRWADSLWVRRHECLPLALEPA